MAGRKKSKAQHKVKAKLRPLSADEFTIRFKSGDKIRKVFKIMFTRDGSIIVAFPYFESSSGLVSLCTMQPGIAFPTNIDLKPGGKATSHLVKYSHHRSGEALFSQTGKVYSAIRRQSVPLAAATGHLFTIQLQGLDSFDEVSDEEDDAPWSPSGTSPPKRNLTLQFESGSSDSLKFLAFCHSRRALRKNTRGKRIGPVVTVQSRQGTRKGWLLSALAENPASSTFILLMAQGIAPLTEEAGGHLTFIGGFDPPEIGYDHSQPTSFLALSYPADAASLTREIGSIDYRPEASPL